jgi:lipopolysaccharide transport system ATP-binding protein
VERFGPSLEVVHAYEEHLAAREAASRAQNAREEPAGETTETAVPARLLATRWADSGADVRAGGRLLRTGEPVGLDLEWESDSGDRRFHLGVGIDRADGVQLCSFATHQDGLPPFAGARRRRVRLLLPELPILRGEFALYLFLLDEEGLHVYDQQVVHGAFRVESDAYRIGLVTLPHRWEPMEGALSAGGYNAEARLATPRR